VEKQLREGVKMNCEVVVGGVTEIEVDAIAKLIPASTEKRQDEVDLQIWQIAGDWFQNQVEERLTSTKDGEVIVAEGGDAIKGLPFRDIIYVRDDGEKELPEIVFTALKAAQSRGVQSLALPVLWRGIAPLKEAVDQMCTGIRRFRHEFDDPKIDIKIAVGNDPVAFKLVKEHNH
jgi:O-acetyl-ADP-ribose deacetylase (regulator of RNase III)